MSSAMRARVVLLWVVVFLAGVLAASGVWLTFTYRPSAAQAWRGVSDPTPLQWPRMIHLVATWLIVPASAGLAAFDDSFRFVLIGGTEVSQRTLRLWFIVHGAVLTVIFSATLATVIRAGPRRFAD